MDKEKRNKIIFLMGSILVALMFISSYGAFGNNNSMQSTTTIPQKSSNVKTYYVTNNYVNATIYNYSGISLTFSRNTSNHTISDLMNALTTNGLISDYVLYGSTYELMLSNSSAIRIQNYLLSENISANVSATAMIRIPSKVTMFYYNQSINCTTNHNTFYVSLNKIMPLGSKIPVHLTALVLGNGAVYGDNITCTYKGVECK
ncbi:MAG: hypothetical protein ACP5TL_02130 [Candidatus Micrarchaeia archaeon]